MLGILDQCPHLREQAHVRRIIHTPVNKPRLVVSAGRGNVDENERPRSTSNSKLPFAAPVAQSQIGSVHDMPAEHEHTCSE